MELSLRLEGEHAGRHSPAAHKGRVSSKSVRTSPRANNTLRRIGWIVFCTILAGGLVFGWINRNERHWVPDTGLGYWLGIAGAVVMLALLIYPLRKRMPSLRFLGSVPAWFRLHMAFGLLGPSLILLHCNFKSQSFNATVALNAMLIVAGSGLIGRYLYSHVHSTLSGKRRAASSFFQDAAADGGFEQASSFFGLSNRSLARVSTVTEEALKPSRNLIDAIGHAWLVRWQTRQLSRSLRREISARHSELLRSGAAPRRQLGQARRSFEQEVAAHLSAVRNAASLSIYDRMFSLWHFLHLPLFMMLVIAAIVHVIAVHLY